MRIEPATPAEVGFVARTMKRSPRWLPGNACLSHDAYWTRANAAVDRMFARGAECLVAVSPTSRFLYGYIVYEWDRVHHLYVRDSFRGLGIAKRLLAFYDGPKQYTCVVWPSVAKRAAKRGWTYVEAGSDRDDKASKTP